VRTCSCPAFKLLTYYGSAKQRKEKRQGWSKPNAFHVCITSYTLVLQVRQGMPIIGWGGSRVHTAGNSVIVKCLVVLLDTLPEMTLLLFWISSRSRTTEVTGDTINMAWCAGMTPLPAGRQDVPAQEVEVPDP
jgi:hypothetical protein